MLNELNNTEISIKEILFFRKSNAKVKILIKSKNLDLDTDKILDETKQKSDISDFGHIEKVSKIKLDKFYKFLEDRIEKELKNSNFDEDYPEIEMKKVNGKWQLEFDFNTFINENFFNE